MADRTGSKGAIGKMEKVSCTVLELQLHSTLTLQNVRQTAIQKPESLSLVLLSTTDAATAGARQPLEPHGVQFFQINQTFSSLKCEFERKRQKEAGGLPVTSLT